MAMPSSSLMVSNDCSPLRERSISRERGEGEGDDEAVVATVVVPFSTSRLIVPFVARRTSEANKVHNGYNDAPHCMAILLKGRYPVSMSI